MIADSIKGKAGLTLIQTFILVSWDFPRELITKLRNYLFFELDFIWDNIPFELALIREPNQLTGV